METSVINNLRHGLNDISETMPLAMARQIRIPLFWETVPAGAPEYREGYVDEYIDFYKYFIKNPDDAYIVRVSGESMVGANIYPGDLLIVERGGDSLRSLRRGGCLVQTGPHFYVFRKIIGRFGNPIMGGESVAIQWVCRPLCTV